MKAILIKEINEFMNSLIAYLVIGIFLICIGLLMWVFPDSSVLDYGYASMETLFSLGPYVFIFLVSAITMRSFADEKRNGTLEILYTLPFRGIEIVLGKFFAGFLLVILTILPTLVYYYSIYQLGYPVGNIDTAGVIGSYIGLLLLCSVFTSIGIFSSALTGNSLTSFVLSAFLCFLMYSGFDAVSKLSSLGDVGFYMEKFGIISHYLSLSRGLIEFHDIIYFLSVTFFLLFTTHLTINDQKG